ncbi:hypothetical protein HC891_12070 [Candidatus Gracilibacteria bacterium]|nr:hypothetical protein [Candidatus Gracilibacteria bacterium]
MAVVATALRHGSPQTSEAAAYEVAYGLVCMVQAHESLLELGLDHRYTAIARASAERLIKGLAK